MKRIVNLSGITGTIQKCLGNYYRITDIEKNITYKPKTIKDNGKPLEEVKWDVFDFEIAKIKENYIEEE